MTQIELLDPAKHGGLRIRQGHGPGMGEEAHLVQVLANELRELAVELPVCMVKNPETGQFNLVALLGFRNGENLLLGADGSWQCDYVPLEFRRQPFVVAHQGEAGRGGVAIDVDHPRVSRSDGVALFDDDLGTSTLVEEYRPVLETMMSGVGPTRSLISALADRDLIAPGRIEVPDPQGDFVLEGFYVVDGQAMAALDGASLLELNRAGFLLAAHLMIASMANVPRLLSRRGTG